MLLFLLKNLYSFTNVQDNVFVQMHCSIQYRVIKENADDAFYELQNPMEQIIQLMYLMSESTPPLTAHDPCSCRHWTSSRCRQGSSVAAAESSPLLPETGLRKLPLRHSSRCRNPSSITYTSRHHHCSCYVAEHGTPPKLSGETERERSWCRFLLLLSTPEFVLAAALPCRYCSASPLLAKGKGEGWWWLPVVDAARNREGDETGTAAAWRTSRRRERHRGCPPSSPLLRCLATSRLRHGCHVTPPGRRDDAVAAPCSVKLPLTGEGRQGCRNPHCGYHPSMSPWPRVTREAEAKLERLRTRFSAADQLGFQFGKLLFWAKTRLEDWVNIIYIYILDLG
nr:hypersensitive-induced response protein 4 [Ipomoea batatas]